MEQNTLINTIEQQEWLKTAGDALQPAVVDAFKAGGETGQQIKNALHGTWLGHPLHPAITDVPVGSWTTAAVLDTMELLGQKKYAPGADAAVAVGLVGAVGAALSGLADWTGTTKEKRKLGLMHGMLNAGAAALYVTSLLLRRRRKTRGAAIGLSMLGYGIVGAGAYLGGHLVYSKRIGVDHSPAGARKLQDFVVVLPEKELAENSMRCVKAGDVPVLLARQEGKVFALAHSCSHMGGPLSDGDLLADGRVRCPWHGSVFSLEDGKIEQGPASEPQPAFEVRVRDGQIEVRSKG
ncbi:nitrite reductase/ring-hydroxylating ferredoxin subunit [Pontibacter ummariensis]|uniref:Ferredoxin subunit of nitrite reductase or a ring-hydroxylating dioxygenase n=1 Tax=Pontibacter ummariensis TaxID=1610492 RepID=A0A239F5V1_9BACT|nr:Rieske 2Fe-2S domain-containing protein [Pontibacter ummariensis]PRY12418.1 nitrite reductase/ring-hydroxylating ferredoxin subunit [Pontibacter ummariensis]SNS52111.1 Ferredoxin subunit of nitrite reductase or a ring-hydroxylating dioxygenase [Pontibacter ummariensis]